MSTPHRTAARRGFRALCWGWSMAAALVLMTGCVVDTSDESDVDEWVDQDTDLGEYSSELVTNGGPSGGESEGNQSSRTNSSGNALGNGYDPDPEPWVGPPVAGGPSGAEDEEQGKSGQAP